MNTFPRFRKLALLAAAAFAAIPAPAQVPGASGSLANAALLKLLGTNSAFTTHADFRVLNNKDKKEVGSAAVTFALLDGRSRMEFDVKQMKSPQIPPTFVSTMTQLGLDQTIVVSRPDTKQIISIFPKARSFAQVAMTKEETTDAGKSYTVTKTAAGKETVDSHPCEKNQVTLTDEKGDKMNVLVWNATDLKDFPVQILMPAGPDNSVDIHFKDIKLAKPDEKLFDAPTNFTRYTNTDELTDAVIKAHSAAGAIKK